MELACLPNTDLTSSFSPYFEVQDNTVALSAWLEMTGSLSPDWGSLTPRKPLSALEASWDVMALFDTARAVNGAGSRSL